ncbi:Acetyltransferase BOT5 [Fulvia fulva]|uniref:Acetyltransferase BOT5 n=1 Tax=Passalora fulva TaxID=5499 RepID=A0A9Q8LIB5_PASFU|nr:Acetyltransferase BOT5 [Fulvia fulva]KAK4624440.1 Acetyltransferase BOT5 [Fulvia fulva]KAK4624894.1 Acetyltransferase BOT5 [Fulvia fulva]UJO18004.1 Acetyltransferase BOT5 [Fulvia fulva]WPV14813.1 Acetyltransferase BOT5 [Fulvia fulva]WPV29913.1 Acetyltransferase BOT5 [Fulvia fulva]
MEDEIYPLHSLDDTKSNRQFVSWLLRFNDVLNAEVLHDALCRLLGQTTWRKLGGRLKQRTDAKLEIHVPRAYTVERPAVAYHHQSISTTNIDDHAPARCLPRGFNSSRMKADVLDMGQCPFIWPTVAPSSVEETIDRDMPLLSIRITTFKDATLVSLSWPHVVMDAMGARTLLHCWSLVLLGKDREVPVISGTNDDVLLQEAQQVDSNEVFALEHKRLTGAGELKWGTRSLWDSKFNEKHDFRAICMTPRTMERLKERVRGEIAHAPNSTAFASEHDVLVAWITRAIALSRPKSARPMTVVSLYDIRCRLPTLLQTTSVYVQNMSLVTFTFLSSQATTGSLGSIAVENRRHFAEQTTEAQTLKLLRATQRDIKTQGAPKLLFGEWNAEPLLINNLTKAGIVQSCNFGPAVIRQGESTERRNNPIGTMTSYSIHDRPAGSANFLWVLGKDHGQNYYIMAKLRPKVWQSLEKDLG